MKPLTTRQLIAGLTAPLLLALSHPSGAWEAKAFYPTSVVPTMPEPADAKDIKHPESRGPIQEMQHAFRAASERGWAGIPAADRGLSTRSEGPTTSQESTSDL
jgi:hypothetical protein